MNDLTSRQAVIDAGVFKLIKKYKKKLIEATNIKAAPDEMAVLDSILFRFWQMGWLDKLELLSAQPEIIRCKDCKHRYEDECPMHHVEWVEYDDDGYIDSDDVIYDYTEDDGYCFKAERRTG